MVAYEPVWAIGTGLTPTTADVEEVHRFIRGVLTERFKDEGAEDPDPLWRLGQALERGGTDGGRQRQRRTGRRRQPEGVGLSGDRGGLLKHRAQRADFSPSRLSEAKHLQRPSKCDSQHGSCSFEARRLAPQDDGVRQIWSCRRRRADPLPVDQRAR